MGKTSKNSVSRKRRLSNDFNVDLDCQTPSDSPAVAKRVRLSTNTTDITTPNASAAKAGSDQKMALLGIIRQRLSELDGRTIYLRRLPRNTTLEHLKKLCPQSVNSRIQSTKFASRRKHAFIEFKSRDLARTTLKAISGKLLADRPIHAELCSDRMAPRSDGKSGELPTPHWIPPHQRRLTEFSRVSLHITCIPRSASQDDVRTLFPKACKFDFHMHPKNKGIGSCRIVFSSEADALEAFQTKHGALVRDCPLIVNFAFKKHKRRSTKQQDSANSHTTENPPKKVKSNSGEPVSKRLQNQQTILPSVHENPMKNQKKKGKKSNTQQAVIEPPIVPLYHAPLGSNTLKEGKQAKNPKSSTLRTSPAPKKMHRPGKSEIPRS